MIESLKTRWSIILVVLAISVAWVVPNFADLDKVPWWPSHKKIVYGLDIQGGLHLVMGVNVNEVIKEKIVRLSRSLESEFKTQNISVTSVKVLEGQEDQVRIEASSGDMAKKVNEYLEKYYPATLQVLEQTETYLTVGYYQTRVTEYKKQVVNQAIEVIRNRIDEFGVAEPSITSQGEDRILVQLPGIENANQAKDLINRTAQLSFRIVSPNMSQVEVVELVAKAEEKGNYTLGKVAVSAEGKVDAEKDQTATDKELQDKLPKERLGYQAYLKRLNADLKDQLPKDTQVVFEKTANAVNLEAGKIPYLIETTTNLTGELLEDASVSFGERGEHEVVFRLSGEGKRMFAELTGKAVKDANAKGQQLGYIAIVLDGVIKSAPSVKEEINSFSARITLGSRDPQGAQEEANFIATALRAGALPAALEQLEERTVGPTLGADSIARGKNAGLLGGLLVLIFMLVYYRFLGVIANFALSFNILLILAALTSLGATLTLPGVAGIVLTIGMAVDANVIIFERIKEEMRKGAGLQAAIKDGFDHAFSAIFDANITTAAVCVVLMYFGSGPVRGFAVTLICGIITSMFTAIFVSRAMMEFCVIKLKMKKIVSV